MARRSEKDAPDDASGRDDEGGRGRVELIPAKRRALILERLKREGAAGIQELAGNATLLYYMSEEAKEFHSAQREKRKPNARKYPWLP